MKKYLFLLLLLSTAILSADTYVDGYTRDDGTYVEGHYRSSPNDTVSDNYSTEGNENPYTGEDGSREVYDDGYNSADVVTPNGAWDDMPGTSSSKDNTGWIILGVIIGLGLIITILKTLGKIMFVSYLAANAKAVFWTWIILTLLNQIVFFGACLAPYCILASIPHVSLITFGIMYLMYKSALTTFDPNTGYNQFGYDKDGYDKYGYGYDGYDRDGYNAKGIDREGKDRLGKGSFGRMFSGSEHNDNLVKLNEKALKQNIADQENKNPQQMDIQTAKHAEAMAKALNAIEARGNRSNLNNRLVQKDNQVLDNYKKIADKNMDVKNFRLYYKNKPTNLVWYSGHIIYVAKDYFLMKNLININHNTGETCTLYKSDVALIDEMKANHLVFTLAEDIEELMNRINASGIKGFLTEEVGVETTSYVDYSKFDKPIYDEDGSWEIKS